MTPAIHLDPITLIGRVYYDGGSYEAKSPFNSVFTVLLLGGGKAKLMAAHGKFDFVLAMDSLIYYGTRDITDALARLGERTRAAVVFTVAPKTPFLMTFWSMGKLFPRADRSPIMVPHAFSTLHRATKGRLTKVERVSRGFYISECLEYRA